MGVLDVPSLHPRAIAAFENQNVLFDDDFRDGLCGWSGLRNTGINFFPSLSPVASKGPHSMCLDVSDGVIDSDGVASKRVTLREKLIRWHSRVGWTSDTGATGLRYIRWAIDQEDTTHRYWAELRYTNYDEVVGDIAPKWEVQIGATGAFVYQDIGFAYELGYNQKNKVDFTDVTLEFDMATKRYRRLIVNGNVVDLSAIVIAQSDKLAPPGTYFTNGQNYLFYCSNRHNNANTKPTLFVDRTRAEVVA